MLHYAGDKDLQKPFLNKHADTMPRVTLRYAIEHLDRGTRNPLFMPQEATLETCEEQVYRRAVSDQLAELSAVTIRKRRIARATPRLGVSS